MDDCIFCKIIKGEIPSTKRFEDDNIIGINDVNPVRDTHVLFIPKEHIRAFEEIEDDAILSSVRRGVQQVVREEGLLGNGYKIVVNGGGAQEINHLHFHLIGPIGKNAKV